jgi:hypothetical protein
MGLLKRCKKCTCQYDIRLSHCDQCGELYVLVAQQRLIGVISSADPQNHHSSHIKVPSKKQRTRKHRDHPAQNPIYQRGHNSDGLGTAHEQPVPQHDVEDPHAPSTSYTPHHDDIATDFEADLVAGAMPDRPHSTASRSAYFEAYVQALQHDPKCLCIIYDCPNTHIKCFLVAGYSGDHTGFQVKVMASVWQKLLVTTCKCATILTLLGHCSGSVRHMCTWYQYILQGVTS